MVLFYKSKIEIKNLMTESFHSTCSSLISDETLVFLIKKCFIKSIIRLKIIERAIIHF